MNLTRIIMKEDDAHANKIIVYNEHFLVCIYELSTSATFVCNMVSIREIG